MAKMQVYLLAAVLLASSAVEVFGRGGGHVVPHVIERKPVAIPDKVKVNLNKNGDFSKSFDEIHGFQNDNAEGNAKVSHSAYGAKTPFATHTQGDAKIEELETDGKGHGDAFLNVKAGGVSKFGNVKSGGVVTGTSRAEDDGEANVKKVEAAGTATDGLRVDTTSGRVKIEDNKADGGHDGFAKNTAGAFAGGSVKGDTESGIKATALDQATNNADSETNAEGHTNANDIFFGTDDSFATGATDTDSKADGRHAEANGVGHLHGGSEGGKTYSTVEVKGTSKSKNLNTHQDSEAHGEGGATATSTDLLFGGAESYAVSGSSANGEAKNPHRGGAKGTGKAVANSGVRHETEAFSKSDTSVNTGVTNTGPKDTNAKASSKHVAAMKSGKGTTSAGGSANVHLSEGAATAESNGGALTVREGLIDR